MYPGHAKENWSQLEIGTEYIHAVLRCCVMCKITPKYLYKPDHRTEHHVGLIVIYLVCVCAEPYTTPAECNLLLPL